VHALPRSSRTPSMQSSKLSHLLFRQDYPLLDLVCMNARSWIHRFMISSFQKCRI
jgi:hypothetical protein